MNSTLTTPTTTTTNGRTYTQFNVWGRGYDTMVGVMGRISVLAFENMRWGASDDRVSEQKMIMETLIAMAVDLGATNPTEAVTRAMEIVTNISNSTQAPILTILEEMEIAVHNTNREFDLPCETYLFDGTMHLMN